MPLGCERIPPPAVNGPLFFRRYRAAFFFVVALLAAVTAFTLWNELRTNARIDEYYELARANGALGGKLIGAGGGGFLMFYTEDKTRLRHALRAAGLREVRMRFDFAGTALVTRS